MPVLIAFTIVFIVGGCVLGMVAQYPQIAPYLVAILIVIAIRIARR